MPLLSLIIPHYNHQRTLPRLFDSILTQSFKDLEVLLVDDRSDASCAPLVEAYRNKGLDVVLLEHRERIYTMKARLAGIGAAKGEIIGFADADDMLWGTEAVEKNVAIFLEEKPDILHFRTARIDADGNFQEWFLGMDPSAQQLDGKAIFHAYVTSSRFQQQSTVWNKYFSRSLALDVREVLTNSSVPRYLEDACICLTAAFHAEKYIGSPWPGYGYVYNFSNEPQKYAEGPERAVYVWHMLRELLPYFEQHGCPKADAATLKNTLTEHLCVKVGHASMAAVDRDGLFISDETVDAMLRHTDAHTLIKVLLLGGSLNARKILDVLGALRPGAERPGKG